MKQALVPETIKPNVSAGSAKASSQMLQWEAPVLRGPDVESYQIELVRVRNVSELFFDPIAELWLEEFTQLYGDENSRPFVFDIPPPPARLLEPGCEQPPGSPGGEN